ncbi:MAG: hypothetical protein Q9222_001691 [Ikaeria aurantiellina]
MTQQPRPHVPCRIRPLLYSRRKPLNSWRVPHKTRLPAATIQKPHQQGSRKAEARSDTDGIGPARSTLASQVKESHHTQITQLQQEIFAVEASVQLLTEQSCQASGSRPDDETMRDFLSRQRDLREEISGLQKDLAGYSDIDPGSVEKKREAVVILKTQAERWTNNIEILEGWFRRSLCADEFFMDGLRRTCYGGEYVEGTGLKDL